MDDFVGIFANESQVKDTIKYYGTFKAQAHGKSEGIIVKMTCYEADFAGKLEASSEISELKWLDYSTLNVKISPVDHIIFKDLYFFVHI